MPVEAYVEATSKRAFAGAIDWPGWCRAGRDEEAALEALFERGHRFASVLEGSRVRFAAPARPATLKVVERLEGDATTDFGAPSIAPSRDASAIDRRWLTGTSGSCGPAGWRSTTRSRAFTESCRRGRRMIAGRPPAYREGAAAADAAAIGAREEERAAVLEGLERALVDGIPEKGPRGGARWTARYVVRRAAWHVPAHAWETEDRSSS
jgi:hypothetical protein